MAIIDPEKRAFGPVLMLSVLRLDNVQYNRYSIFIVGPDKALVSIRCVCSYDTIPPETALGRLMVRNHYPRAWLQRQLPCILLLTFYCCVFMEHLVDIQGSE